MSRSQVVEIEFMLREPLRLPSSGLPPQHTGWDVSLFFGDAFDCDICLAEALRSGKARLVNPEHATLTAERMRSGDLLAYNSVSSGQVQVAGVASTLERLLRAWSDRGIDELVRVAAAVEAAARTGGPDADRLAAALDLLLSTRAVMTS